MTTARRFLSFVLTTVASLTLCAPAAALAAPTVTHSTVSVAGRSLDAGIIKNLSTSSPTAASDADADDAATTTIVASEAPVPNNPGAKSPEIGPIVVPTDSSSFSGAWWLVAFGGVQLVGLLLITRRARARLSLDDAQP